MTDDVTIKIPRPLYRRLQQIVEGTGFRSVTEFIIYVLRDLAASAGGEERPEPPPAAFREEEGLSQEEIEVIRKRLKNLGYLD
ncbi:ribbon-helix-helix domain-containing protein [Limnochorda pilosa]|uniref:CopG family transcriptional regulator n=1 Tax=Limnochorda pilosa TaxID=1555112 RepID=A0A0K2SLX6_LIMPI|nr:hypothetical protein [Limnochorda pilosa]BAS28105.1 hypothetical protein LIP_2264 [Limnochorda pilosa]